MGTTTAVLLAISIMAAPFTQTVTQASVDAEADTTTQTGGWDQMLPKGIWNRLEDGKPLPRGWVKKVIEESEDLDAPEIQFETVYGISSTSARIFWLTNEPSDTQLWVSTSSTIEITTPPTHVKERLSFFHQVGLTELEPNTTYFYVIASTDAAGNQTILTVNSFTTVE